MSENNLALNANVNLKEQPNRIRVHGSVIVYTGDAVVKFTKANPQGTNDTILLLELSIQEGDGPKKGINEKIYYEEAGSHVANFKQVQVRYGDGGSEAPIDVEVFG